MNRKNFFKTAVFATGLSLLPSAHAADVRLLVYGEHAGTDIVYRYTLVNNGTGKMMEFSLGVTPVDGDHPGPDEFVSSYGTLTRLPTGTTFVPDVGGHFGPNVGVPAPNPTNVTSPAQPAGWSAKVSGFRGIDAFAIIWKAPQNIYGGPEDATGAGAGQTLSGFSVRVPATSATGPGVVGALAPYTTGEFSALVWLGKTAQQIFAPIEKQDTLPPTLSVALSPSTLRPNEKLVSIAATITVKDDYDPLPEIKLESITANEPLEKEDIKDAHIGTDDRQFKLKAEREGKNKAGRIYTVTYSATDASGNKITASATVTVPQDERKKDD
jgi:hypothetical protein